MNSGTNKTERTVVGRLIEAVRGGQVSIHRLPENTLLQPLDICEIRLKVAGKAFTCLADNEYGDMDTDNLPLQLGAILSALDHVSSAKGFSDWCEDLGLDANLDEVHELWQRERENAATVPQLFTPAIKPISGYDWQLGAGGVKELRALPHRLARPDLHIDMAQRSK